MTEIDLSSKTAVVTGGGSGIGAAVVETLTNAGAKCVVLDVTGANPVDVSDEEQVSTFFRDLEYVMPGPDILVTCAGITRDAMLLEMTGDQFDAVTGVNLRGTFLCVREAARSMLSAGNGGSIVTISSISAAGNKGQINYAATKAGVQALTRTAALELGKYGIRVNCIAPGPVQTPMLTSVPEKIVERWVRGSALGKLALPEDIANAILYLTTPLSSHITGETITVSGGLHF